METSADINIAIERISNLLEELLQDTIHTAANRNFTSSSMRNLIETLRVFKTQGYDRIRISPAAEHTRAINLRESSDKLKKARKDMTHLQTTLDQSRSEFDVKSENLVRQITSNELEIESAKQSAMEQTQSNEPEIEDEPAREMEKAKLQERIRSLNEEFENLRKENLSCERDMRDSCRKVEKRCTTVIAKYDDEIGARYKLLHDLTEERDSVRKEQEEIEYRTTVQSALYARLKDEHEHTVMVNFARKLESFRRNRAATIIQRAWRMYYERTSAKRRKKLRKK